MFIIGAGPQLGQLDDGQLEDLGRRLTLGVNRTQYAVALTYFLSAYPAEVLLAARHERPPSTLIHLRSEAGAPLLAGTLVLGRAPFRFGELLPEDFGDGAPHVRTRRNVALAATHLTSLMGAARIVFVGIEQNSALHYYDTDPALRARVSADLRSIRNTDVFTVDHEYATLAHLLDKLDEPPAAMDSRPFYEQSHVDAFAAYFAELRRRGVEPIATLEESVVARAGAAVHELDEVLTW